MLKDLDLLDDGEVVIVGRHAQHEAVLHVERDLARVAVLADQGVQRVRVGHPPDQPCIGVGEACFVYVPGPNFVKEPCAWPCATRMARHTHQGEHIQSTSDSSWYRQLTAVLDTAAMLGLSSRMRTRVGREGDDGVARDGQVALGGGAVVRKHRVDKPEQLHHSLILPQVLVALQWSSRCRYSERGVGPFQG